MSILKNSCRLMISIICFIFLSVFIQSPIISWLDDDRIGIRHLSSFSSNVVRVCLFLGLLLISLLLIHIYGKKMSINLKDQIYGRINWNNVKYISKYYMTTILITLIVIIFTYSREGNIGELPDFSINPLVFVLRLLTAVVSQPLLEELLFRGVLQERLSRYSQWGALVFSSIVFSYSHDYQTILNFHLFSSFMYGLVYMKTKNVKSAIFLHSLQNLMVIVSIILLN
ncbi:lysostaphin resistance A-like protein [Streptococcus sp. ZJ93]|uniref:CPBP family intramembrane glutamic endopeptidase n=1 Tax=Streptococcus handemini TaxID=3161188 RepID=UPI0032EEA6AB